MATDPSSSTTVCITPPPEYSESPAATAPPAPLFPAVGLPPTYLQQPQNPGQAGTPTTFPPPIASPASPGVGPGGTDVVPFKRQKCTCRKVMRALGYIGLVILMVIFFLAIVAGVLYTGCPAKERDVIRKTYSSCFSSLKCVIQTSESGKGQHTMK